MIDITRAEAITDGWMKREELLWLAERAQSCQNIIEIGSYAGRSTRALADHCPGTVYAVDPWDGDYYRADGSKHRKVDTRQYNAFCSNLADHIASGRCVPLRGTIQTEGDGLWMKSLIHVGADLIFIDGDHRREQLAIDIERSIPLLRPGGILAGHDYGKRDWPDVKTVVGKLFEPECDGVDKYNAELDVDLVDVKALVDERFAYTSVGHCRSIWWVTL